jgi:acyl-CoA thioesterase FadM
MELCCLSVPQSLERVVRLPKEPGEKERVAAESITTSVCLNDKYRPTRFPGHLRTIMARSFGHPDPDLSQD